ALERCSNRAHQGSPSMNRCHLPRPSSSWLDSALHSEALTRLDATKHAPAPTSRRPSTRSGTLIAPVLGSDEVRLVAVGFFVVEVVELVVLELVGSWEESPRVAVRGWTGLRANPGGASPSVAPQTWLAAGSGSYGRRAMT